MLLHAVLKIDTKLFHKHFQRFIENLPFVFEVFIQRRPPEARRVRNLLIRHVPIAAFGYELQRLFQNLLASFCVID